MERERDGGGEPDPPEVSGNERLDERGGGGETDLLLLALLLRVAEGLESVVELCEDIPGLLNIMVSRFKRSRL